MIKKDPEYANSAFVLSKKDQAIFLDRLKYWKRRLGLGEWKIYFDGFGEFLEETYGSCNWNLQGRIATVLLAPEWDFKPKPKDLSCVALHELMEIVLAPLVDMVPATVHPDAVVDATHQIVRHIETMMFDEHDRKNL